MTAQTIDCAIDEIIKNPCSYSILELDHVYLNQRSINRTVYDEVLQHLIDVVCNVDEQRSKIAAVLVLDLLNLKIDKACVPSFEKLIDKEFENKKLRKMQARIAAGIISIQISQYSGDIDESVSVFEEVIDRIQGESEIQAHLGIQIVYNILKHYEENKQMQNLIIPLLMPALLESFTNEVFEARQRSQILHQFYLMIRMIAWADGVDDELVHKCLDSSFSSWMALFLQIIQSNSSKNSQLKINALKCLIVIFRDLMNYSRSSINLILKPTWKMLNQTLPLYTEQVCYGKKIEDSNDQISSSSESQQDYMDDVQGVTFFSLELLATLVMRPNVQQVVYQGIVPLTTTVCSYLILNQIQDYKTDPSYFICDRQEMMRGECVRSQCLVIASSMIEVFGDNAISALLLFIQNCFIDQVNSEQSLIDQVTEEEEFQALLKEHVYMSKNPNHKWKRQEAGSLLLGIFVEDISMYLLRNPQVNIMVLIEGILETKFENIKGGLRQSLIGRSLWTFSQLAEQIGKDQIQICDQVLKNCSNILASDQFASSVKLIATKCMVRYLRKVERLSFEIAQMIEPLMKLLDLQTEAVHLAIEAFTTIAKIDEKVVENMVPVLTPRLLKIYTAHHNEGSIGNDLITLFKLWCKYDSCCQILTDAFIPFIKDLVQFYFDQTQGNSDFTSEVVDGSVLAHVLDLLCVILKQTKTDENKQKVVMIFPELLNFMLKSEDMFLLLHGTTTVKTFISFASQQILEISTPDAIIAVTKKLLDPKTNEQSAVCLGNLVIQVIHKIQPKIDTSLLMCVVHKIYKSRMPSIVQSLVLIIARIVQTNPKQIVQFLSETSIDNRICLKIVLDKWLLQQPLFRGTYTRTVTLLSLLKLFTLRDPRIESLMVIGYNPSHSNVNSEVNAPFKILSTLLRFIENELKPTNKKPLRPVIDIEEEKESGATGAFAGYRINQEKNLAVDSGDRMDTMGGGDSDSYGRYDDGLNDSDKLSVDLDDVQDNHSDDDYQKESSSDNQKSTGSSDKLQLFAVGMSKDKGLADMETGSEVYMSELLAGFDMEDFEDAEEANEEDLVLLNDDFAHVKVLVTHIKDLLNQFIAVEQQGCEYVLYCAKQLPKEDTELAKRFFIFPKGTQVIE